MGEGQACDIGPTVRLRIGNVDVIVSSVPEQVMDNGPFLMCGIDVLECRIAALKSAQHFRAWWGPRAGAVFSCDPPGIHSPDLSLFAYENINRDYYPFDPDAQF